MPVVTLSPASEPIIPIIPVTQPAAVVISGPAWPVYVYTQMTAGDLRVEGDVKPLPVFVIHDADLVQNGGPYKLAGNVKAIPVIDYTNIAPQRGGPAQPIYVVGGQAL